MIQALWFLAGAAVATLVMAIVNVIFVLKDGTLHITKTEDKETYLFEISNLDKLDGKKQIVLKISREEHISGMKTVNEAIDRLTKIEEMRTKATIEEAKRLTEESIAQANLEETKRNDRRKVIVDSLSIGIPAVLSAWSFVTGLLYEERGIVKSNIVRKIFDKIITMRK